MGNALCACQWLLEDGSTEYHSSNGLMLASRKKIKPSRIPLSQLCLSDVIIEDETEDVSHYKFFNQYIISELLSETTLVSFFDQK